MAIKNAVAIKRRDDFRKYKAVVAKRQRDFVETGTALGLIRRDALYKEGGFASFEEFVEAEFDMPKSTAYRLIDAARVVTILSQVGTIQEKIVNQSQALQLAPLGRDRAAMVAVIEGVEARGSKITAATLEAVRAELYPHIKVIEGEIVGDRHALEGGDEPTDTDAAADGANASADEEHYDASPSGVSSSAGHAGDSAADEPGNPPTDHRGTADPGEADDAGTSSAPSAPPVVPGADGQASDAGAERPAESPPADEADQEQASEGVPAPAPPHLGDPAALVEWFADLFEQVDVDVSGPLLTTDDFQLIDKSLGRIAGIVQLLVAWHDRAQR